MDDKLSHLTSDQILEMMERYYEGGDKVASLVEEYCIDVHVSGFVGVFPLYIHQDQFCPFCPSHNFVSKRLGRDHGPWKIGYLYCPSCNHRDDPYCHCAKCEEKEKNEKQHIDQLKQEVIKEQFGAPSADIPPAQNLSLSDAIYLLSIARHSLSEDLHCVKPFAEPTPQFAPTFDFQNQITRHLYSKGLISISCQSEPSAFAFDEDITTIPSYFPTQVIWEFLPAIIDVNRTVYLNELEEIVRDGPWPETWKGNILKCWREIAKFECFEYYLHLLQQRDFEPDKIGPKTHSVFESMLEKFAVSQIFNLTWQAVRDTTDYIVKENLPRYHAKNSFIGAIQRKADKAIANSWEVRHSRRDFDCPQTVVSSTFSDVFLEIGHNAFETVPFAFEKEL